MLKSASNYALNSLHYFSVKLSENMKASSFKNADKVS